MSYPKSSFIEKESDKLFALMTKQPLATVSVICNGEIQTVFLPLSLSPDKSCLLGHAIKNNPIFYAPGTIQAVFHGGEEYLSPDIIPDIKLPTWLYSKVQVKGKLELITEQSRQYSSMQTQLSHFERLSKSHWQLDSIAEKPRQQLFNAIQFFQIHITQMRGDFKLSQNKSTAVRQQIQNYLRQQKSSICPELIAT